MSFALPQLDVRLFLMAPSIIIGYCGVYFTSAGKQELVLVMRIALSLFKVQIYMGIGMAWRSHGSSNADLVQKLKGALQLDYTDYMQNLSQ